MVKNNLIRIKVSKTQKEQLKYLANLKDMTLSDFVREKIFQNNYLVEKMLIEIHNKVIQNG